MMQRFTELRVWQEGREVVAEVYRLTASFPKNEIFGLTSQLRRCAVSVVANIAEGSKRRSGKEYAHFLNVAEGSLAESECLLLLSQDMGFVNEPVCAALRARIAKIAGMLSNLRERVETEAECAR